jgi:hypothetical protein
MLPNSNKVQFTGQGGSAGQPVQPATPPAQPEATPQSLPAGQQPVAPAEGFTPAQQEQIAKIVASALAQTSEELRRKQQSETAKAEERIKRTVSQQLDVMKKANMQVTPETEQAVERIVRQNATQPDNDPGPATAQPQPGDQQPEVHPIDAAAFAMMDARGIDLEPNDPEVASLDRSSPQAYLASLDRALSAKAARVGTSPSARIPAGSGGSPAPTALPDDTDQLWKLARQQMSGRR